MGAADWVFDVATATIGDRDVVLSAGDDALVHVWCPVTGRELLSYPGHTDCIKAVCGIRVAGRDLVASAGDDGTVRVWDVGTDLRSPREPAWPSSEHGHEGEVLGLCELTVDGRGVLASAGDDETIRLVDSATGEQLRTVHEHTGAVLAGHRDWVRAVCGVRVEGRDLLVSAGDDRTVRLWDPVDGQELLTVPVHHEARAVAAVGEGALAVGLTVGVLVLDLGCELVESRHGIRQVRSIDR